MRVVPPRLIYPHRLVGNQLRVLLAKVLQNLVDVGHGTALFSLIGNRDLCRELLRFGLRPCDLRGVALRRSGIVQHLRDLLCRAGLAVSIVQAPLRNALTHGGFIDAHLHAQLLGVERPLLALLRSPPGCAFGALWSGWRGDGLMDSVRIIRAEPLRPLVSDARMPVPRGVGLKARRA